MSGTRVAILVILVLLVCLVVGALGVLVYRLFLAPPPVIAVEEGPVILIDSPGHGDEVTVGEAAQIFATGRDPSRIARMELWVDGEMIQSQASALPGGTNPFPLMGIWVPNALGNHTIVVRGYNTNDVSGQASISVNAVAAPAVPEGCEGVAVFDHEVQMGETLEGIAAGYELTVEQILACNPGLDPAAMPTPGEILHIPAIVSPEEEGPPPDWEPPPVEPPPDLPPEEELPGEELPPAEEDPPPGEEPPPAVEEPPEPEGLPDPPDPPDPPEPPVVLGFEALEFEVDQLYDDVYCMARLADADMERVPDAGSFILVGGNYWDIQAELAGVNSRMVSVTGDFFRIEVECFGWIGINGYSLGHFIREHGEAEWTGELIEVTAIADDGRWFRVVYRICPDFPCEPRPVPDAPENLHHFTFFGLNFLGWDWGGHESDIDGFRLYRNGSQFLQTTDPTRHWVFLLSNNVNPPCGETYSYDLTAYEGFPGVGLESDHSNTVDFVGPPCPRTVVVTFETLHTGCVRADPCGDPTCGTCYVPNFEFIALANGEWLQREPHWGPPSMESYSEAPIDDLMHLGDASVTVELDPADNLSMAIVALDWDPPFPGVYSTLLLGGRTLTPAQVATGDYWLFTHTPGPWPWDAWAFVKVHLEVTP